MRTATALGRSLGMLLLLAALVPAATAQRTVTLRLNTATIPDTIQTSSVIKVMGAVDDDGDGNFTAPFTLPDGRIISWTTSGAGESTLDVTNVGGDYWQTTFQVPNNATTQFKFFSRQADQAGINGWEADPNPTIGPGAADTTLVLHYFESQQAFRNLPGGDKGPYDWRPYAERQDSVMVWFRVYMATEAAVSKGFIGGSDQITVAVRGGPPAPGAMADWSANIATLTRESNDPESSGYFLYSGPIYYPLADTGKTQAYKFVFVQDGVTQWEDSPDRSLVIPAQDTTLRWVYYSNSRPTENVPTTDARVEAFVTFTVDITPLEATGLFDAARGDAIQVRGGFNDWSDANPDRSQLRPNILQQELWQNEIAVKDTIGAPLFHKFYLDQNLPEGEESVATWEEPLDFGGGDRVVTFTGQDLDLGTDFYNNIRAGNVIPEGASIDVTFQVNMRPATGFADAFDPATDQVRISFEDGIWEGIQATHKGLDDQSPQIQYVTLSDPDGDLVYTGTYRVMGPTYNGIGYRVQYGTSDTGWSDEVGDQPGKPGRRRYQYILPAADGSFAATYTLPVVPVQNTFPLPFECNPTLTEEALAALPASVTEVCYPAGTSPVVTGIEEVGDDLPQRVSLEQNYPNPFNPTTTFEYSIPGTQHVTLRVYDVMGRVVATLVDGVQPASTYRVSFDARHLASGVYIYQLQTPTQVVSRKMMLLK